MSKKTQPSATEVNNNFSSDINSDVMHDPLTGGLKDNKEYGHIKANIITDRPGQEIPDIPEQSQRLIDVDFTEAGNSRPGNSSGPSSEGKYEHGFMEDPDDISASQNQSADISEDNKSELAGVVGEVMFTGLDLLNDFIVKKLVVNEDKLKELAMSGEIPFEIINVKVEFTPTFIFDMSEFLNEQEEKTRKALDFKSSEKKHINELLKEVLKSKKFKMTPEGAIFASLVTHYAAAGYQLFMNNQEVMKMITLVAAKYDEEKAQAQHIRNNAARPQKAKVKETAPKQPAGPDIGPEPGENLGSDVSATQEFREPGETNPPPVPPPAAGKPRRTKRTFDLSTIEDAQLT